jgi:hypothetical protein
VRCRKLLIDELLGLTPKLQVHVVIVDNSIEDIPNPIFIHYIPNMTFRELNKKLFTYKDIAI